MLIEVHHDLEKIAVELMGNSDEYLYFIQIYALYFIAIFLTKYVHLRCYVSFPLKLLLMTSYINWNRLFSSDYFSASVFKSLSSYGCSDIHGKYCKTVYVKEWNKFNLCITFALFLAVLVTVKYDLITMLLFYVVYIRFFSRCLEISIAFIKDIFTRQVEQNTFLRKHDRVILAGKSYIEIYILSATVYLTIIPDPRNQAAEAVFQSLNVGTFTNIASAQTIFPENNIIIFTQLLSTMTLVILSFAAYLGRDK